MQWAYLVWALLGRLDMSVQVWLIAALLVHLEGVEAVVAVAGPDSVVLVVAAVVVLDTRLFVTALYDTVYIG